MKKFRNIQLGKHLYDLFSDDVRLAGYRKYYSDASFWSKLKLIAQTAGMKVVYPALLLHYLMKSDETSLKTRLIICAALGYFILPVDFIPDFAPLIGFTDDLGVLLLILRQMSGNITPEIRQKAREHLHKWFGEPTQTDLYLWEKDLQYKTH